MPAAPDIRLLSAADLDGAFTLSSTAGWNQRIADWRMLMELAPAGSFCAITQGRIVGTAIGIDYGRFGWIAMMIVDPAYRGQGLGGRLLEAAMGAVPSDQPIRLDATPLGRPLYRRYGFEDETMISRMVAEPSRRRADMNAMTGIRPLIAADIHGVAQHDTGAFGGNRHVVLQWSLDHGPKYACIAQTGAGLPQYCFGRTGRLFDQIGPIVAENSATATALAATAIRAAGNRPVVIDAYDAHHTFIEWLRETGFQVQRPLYRMCRQGNSATAARESRARSPLHEFAILGPEFG